ncbi:MAG: glycosyltransferase family 39 protein [Candidatus Hydrogenedentota bacterium]
MSMPEPKVRSTARTDLLIAVPIAFALRLGFLIASARAIDMADSIHYINMGRGFAQGDFVHFDENLPVLYSLFGALSFLLTNDWEWAFWVVSLLASTLLVIPIYFIAEELHGSKSARLSVFIVAAWPWLVDYGSRIAPEALAVTLWFSSIWLLYRGIQGSRFHLALAPIAFFALHLSRPEGTFLMLGSPLAATILCYKRDRAHWTRLAVYTCGILMLTVVYAVVMNAILGNVTVSYRAPMSDDVFDYFRRGAIPLAKTFMRLNFDVVPVMLGPLLLVFFGVGFFRYSDNTRKPRLEGFILFFCLVQWSLTLANFSPEPRYLMTVIIALSLWSAKGIELLYHRAFYWNKFRWARFVPVILILLTFTAGLAEPIAGQYISSVPRTPVEYRTAGKWMRENLEPGYIFCRKPQVGFYADMPSIGPDVSHTPELLAQAAKEIGARYVVFDMRYSANILPALRPLLDTTTDHENYRLLNGDLSENLETQIVIYEITTPGIKYLTQDNFPGTSSHMGPDRKRRETNIP